MKQKLKLMILALSILFSNSLILAPTVNADFKADACQGINTLNGSSSTNCPSGADTKLRNLLRNIIQTLSIIIGFIAVIMVIVGGLKYVTANGDSSALASARNTIIYALIGLIIVAIAQILVHFVISKSKL